ncbi:MAG: AAA family ATPase, partial [Oscillospiraceae bacterium]|nr:AAA family ATPase [Oscillospiraceae bacterium]
MKRKANDPRSAYILAALERHCLNGDAYVMVEELYALCCTLRPRLGYEAFERDFTEQLGFGNLCREGRRIYLAKTLRYEEAAAKHLADILQENERPLSGALPDMSEEIGVELAAEQRNAVNLALSHRLSIILGGAGSGKTTLIRAICRCAPRSNGKVICAPTGKAARNLTERTGLVARTVHSALGMQPNDDFLSPVLWEHVGLVVVDEASMLSLEMLAGLLCKMRPQCTMVLLGDPNQLLSVGSGNVLPDLLRLGIPAVHLEQNYRQADAAAGLQGNVVNFSRLGAAGDLA